jgi:hypothetical protein
MAEDPRLRPHGQGDRRQIAVPLRNLQLSNRFAEKKIKYHRRISDLHARITGEIAKLENCPWTFYLHV